MGPSVSTHRARSAAAHTGSAVRAAAFWSAVGLPAPIIGLLAVGAPLPWVASLLLCNAAALVVGHDYRTCPNHEG
jgi:hypothetical protein